MFVIVCWSILMVSAESLSDNFKINIVVRAMLVSIDYLLFNLKIPWYNNWFSVEILTPWVCYNSRSCLNLLSAGFAWPWSSRERWGCKSRFPMQTTAILEMGQFLVTSGSLPNLHWYLLLRRISVSHYYSPCSLHWHCQGREAGLYCLVVVVKSNHCTLGLLRHHPRKE